MLTTRVFDPDKLGILSRLPLELRQDIYDHMCRIDSEIFNFEAEGRNNLHIPGATLKSLQHRRFLRVAHVCSEMREYSLRYSPTPITFTCYQFGAEPINFSAIGRWERLKDQRTITGFFSYKYDTLAFTSYQMMGDEFDMGEGDDPDFIRRNNEAMRKLEIFLFPGSGGLPPADTAGWTRFEDFVRMKRDEAIQKNPDIAAIRSILRIENTGSTETGIWEEHIQQYGSSAVLRSYDIRELPTTQ